ncbi:SET domain-containing protein 5 [Podospora conica]|nr:SET domain-containing protein 5 [Schizothecium conicum]
MRLVHTFLLSACACAAHGHDQIPLTPPTDTCLPDSDTCPVTSPKLTTDHQPPPPYRWTGPFQCAGPYCIYSNPGFASGLGLVAITTASNIALLNQTTTPAPAPSAPPPPITIAPVPPKGLGVLSTAPLRRGDPLLTVPAAFLVHRAFQETTPYLTQTPLLDAAVLHLPPARRALFLAQAGHFGGHPVADILATNTFQLNLGGPDGHHFAAFPEASRFNHDCRPNVAGRIEVDVARGSILHKTTVVRDVRAGEELAITYLDAAEPRAKRVERTQMAWGFECGCAQCGLAKKAARASDERLAEIKRLEGRLADVQDGGVTVGMLRRVVRLYREERLEVEMAGVLTLVALNYNMLGEDKLARKYALEAREAVLIEYGEGTGDAEGMRVLAEAPKEHFSWRARVGR